MGQFDGVTLAMKGLMFDLPAEQQELVRNKVEQAKEIFPAILEYPKASQEAITVEMIAFTIAMSELADKVDKIK